MELFVFPLRANVDVKNISPALQTFLFEVVRDPPVYRATVGVDLGGEDVKEAHFGGRELIHPGCCLGEAREGVVVLFEAELCRFVEDVEDGVALSSILRSDVDYDEVLPGSELLEQRGEHAAHEGALI